MSLMTHDQRVTENEQSELQMKILKTLPRTILKFLAHQCYSFSTCRQFSYSDENAELELCLGVAERTFCVISKVFASAQKKIPPVLAIST